MTVELRRGVSQAEALEHIAATGTPYDTLTVPALATLSLRGAACGSMATSQVG